MTSKRVRRRTDITPTQAQGRKLRWAREMAALSIGEVARRAGISRQALQQLEHGDHDPALATLRRLADVLGVSVSALVR